VKTKTQDRLIVDFEKSRQIRSLNMLILLPWSVQFKKENIESQSVESQNRFSKPCTHG